MSRLHALLDDYLALRLALGFKLCQERQLLPGFVDFVEQAGAESVTVELALAWAKKPTGVDPFRWKRRLSMVRGFARYAHAFAPATEVPPIGLLAYRATRPTPFLLSEQDITVLLAAAEALRPPLLAVTCRTLFGLLAVTGLRVGEAIALDREDVDLVRRLLTVRQTKFNKSRLLPLHPSTNDALATYTQQRDRFCPKPKAASFLSRPLELGCPITSPARCLWTWPTMSASNHARLQVIPGCMDYGTASWSTRCSVGIAMASTWLPSCQRCPRISAIAIRLPPIGIYRRFPSC